MTTIRAPGRRSCSRTATGSAASRLARIVGQSLTIENGVVSPGYLLAAGIQIVAGRDFDPRDVRPNPFVMAIHETFDRRIQAMV